MVTIIINRDMHFLLIIIHILCWWRIHRTLLVSKLHVSLHLVPYAVICLPTWKIGKARISQQFFTAKRFACSKNNDIIIHDSVKGKMKNILQKIYNSTCSFQSVEKCRKPHEENFCCFGKMAITCIEQFLQKGDVLKGDFKGHLLKLAE